MTLPNLNAYPKNADGTPIAQSGTQTRTRTVPAAAWRGFGSPETFFLDNGASVVLDSAKALDRYRAYHVVIRNAATGATWAGVLTVGNSDGTASGTVSFGVFAAAAAPFGTPVVGASDAALPATSVTFHFDTTNNRYLLINGLGSSAAAYVTINRIG